LQGRKAGWRAPSFWPGRLFGIGPLPAALAVEGSYDCIRPSRRVWFSAPGYEIMAAWILQKKRIRTAALDF
jgi:hypothetical protein